MEGYYRDTYPEPMRKRVFDLLPKNVERLSALYDILIRDPEAWKRSVKVPDVVAVEKGLTELYDTYPEFAPYSYNQQVAHASGEITEDAGFDYSEEIGNLTERVLQAVRERKVKIGSE